MPSDATEKTDLDESPVDGARGDIEAELALDAPRRGELLLLCFSNDGGLLLGCGLALAAGARLVVHVAVLLVVCQAVGHGAHVARNALRDVGVVAALLVKSDDRPALLCAEVAVRVCVMSAQRQRRRGLGRGSGGGGCCGRLPLLRVVAVVAPAAMLEAQASRAMALGAEELHVRQPARQGQARKGGRAACRERRLVCAHRAASPARSFVVLTEPGMLTSAAVLQGLSASLQTAQQAQRA